jgi:menaquinone-dependent protoporphyrinogen oxidase
MKVLVSAASKHGATAEIADRIGEVFNSRGIDTTVTPPDPAMSLEEYDAIVLGSAVYAGNWRKEAKELADRIAASHPDADVWLFSSGPLGDPLKPEEAPVDIADIQEAVSPHDHRVFAGKVDKANLGFGERAIMIAVHAPDGDFRDWAAIESWAMGIAESLESRG